MGLPKCVDRRAEILQWFDSLSADISLLSNNNGYLPSGEIEPYPIDYGLVVCFSILQTILEDVPEEDEVQSRLDEFHKFLYPPRFGSQMNKLEIFKLKVFRLSEGGYALEDKSNFLFPLVCDSGPRKSPYSRGTALQKRVGNIKARMTTIFNLLETMGFTIDPWNESEAQTLRDNIWKIMVNDSVFIQNQVPITESA